jgi:exportin-7
VTTAILKFTCEFVSNKNQRLNFEISSPNGILLFRVVSKLLVTHTKTILGLTKTNDEYKFKYKSMRLCLQSLSLSFGGCFCNFGIFQLYGDSTLEDAINASFNMIFNMPIKDILAYRKVSRAYFSLLEIMCYSHMLKVLFCDNQIFMFLLESLESGLRSIEDSTVTHCAASLDHILSFYFKQVLCPEIIEASFSTDIQKSKERFASLKLFEHFSNLESQMLPKILKTLIELAIFEENTIKWSLSRPMYPLVLCVGENVFFNIQKQLISMLPSVIQEQATKCLVSLIVDLKMKLDSKNRDKFTQRLAACSFEMKKL